MAEMMHTVSIDILRLQNALSIAKRVAIDIRLAIRDHHFSCKSFSNSSTEPPRRICVPSRGIRSRTERFVPQHARNCGRVSG